MATDDDDDDVVVLLLLVVVVTCSKWPGGPAVHSTRILSYLEAVTAFDAVSPSRHSTKSLSDRLHAFLPLATIIQS